MAWSRVIPGIRADRAVEIRETARGELTKLWKARFDFPNIPKDPLEFVRTAPVNIPKLLHGFDIIHLPEIPREEEAYEIAGLIDRDTKEIIVSEIYKHPLRKFTIAHEVGHLVLHPGKRYHRDRPMSGGEHLQASRPISEREADLFAAELQIPMRLLRDVFGSRYGNTRNLLKLDQDDCYHLSLGRPDAITPQAYSEMPALSRAKVIAGATNIRGEEFRSLADTFGVSLTAMAIQLLDCGLVA